LDDEKGQGGVHLLETSRATLRVIVDSRASGAATLQGIVAVLNARGMLTRRVGQWQASNVRGLLARLAARLPLDENGTAA
jgi:hypothetical protein